MGTFRLIIDGGSHGLPDAPAYFRTFPREPSPAGEMTPEPKTTATVKDLTLNDILGEMKKAGNGATVMIVCHAVSSGMLVPLVKGATFTEEEPIAMLEEVNQLDIGAAKIKAMPAKTEDEQKARVNAWKALLKDVKGGTVTGEVTLKEIETFYEQLIGLRATAMRIKGNAAMRALIARINEVRALKLERVELRACNVGRKDSTMKALKKLFGCGKLLAPVVETFFMSRMPTYTMYQLADYWKRLADAPTAGKKRVPGPRGAPVLDQKKMFEVLFSHTTRHFVGFDMPAGHVLRPKKGLMDLKGVTTRLLCSITIDEVVRFHYQGTCAANSTITSTSPDWPKVAEFIRTYVMPGSSYKSGGFPLAGFWVPDPVDGVAFASPFCLPNEPEYLDFIKQV